MKINGNGFKRNKLGICCFCKEENDEKKYVLKNGERIVILIVLINQILKQELFCLQPRERGSEIWPSEAGACQSTAWQWTFGNNFKKKF